LLVEMHRIAKTASLFGALLLLEHLRVEVKLLALQDVPVRATRLARTGRHAGQESARAKGVVKGGVESAGLLAISELLLKGTGLLVSLEKRVRIDKS
jgi:hypothetical protein